jgi:hypothetical protein
VIDESQSSPVVGKTSAPNATWRTTFVKRTSWVWLSRQNIDRIRSEALAFIGESSAPEDARIEWYVTWSPETLPSPNGRFDGKTRHREELRVIETDSELQKDVEAHGLDVIASQITEHRGQLPRVLRYVKFSAIAPGYEASLCVGTPSGLSRHITLTCDSPGSDMPEFFRSISELLSWRDGRSFGAWIVTLIFMVLYPAIAIPILYFKFQHASDTFNLWQAVAFVAAGYLIPLGLMILASIYLGAARVMVSSKGYVAEVFSEVLRDSMTLGQSIFGPMKAHLKLAGGGLAGASFAAMLAYIVAVESADTHTAPIWPYVLFGVLIGAGALLYLAGAAPFKREPREDSTADPAKTESST